MPCCVRPARRDDLPALCTLLGELFAIEADFQADPYKQWRGLELLLTQSQEALLLVAELDGAVVGMCSAQVLLSTAEGGEVALVEDVVVRSDQRGMGVGSRLLAGVESWCLERGIRRLQLLADRGNTPALDFYHTKGWQPTQLTAWRKILA